MTLTLNASDALLVPLAKANEAMRDTLPLMKQIGALGSASAQDAFKNQRLGNRMWPERYPGMSEPFINIAGALQDFAGGRSAPKPNRFQNRPAGVDEGIRGGLLGSITFRVNSPTEAEWGSNKAYADRVNSGGKSDEVAIGQATKDRIKKWLFTGAGNARKGRGGYVHHLNFLLHRKTYSQMVLPRPFLGVTAELDSDMAKATTTYFEKRMGRK